MEGIQEGFIDVEDSKRKFSALITLLRANLDLVNEVDILPFAFDLALKHGITVYDALYVELAREKGIPLVTCDETQAGWPGTKGLR